MKLNRAGSAAVGARVAAWVALGAAVLIAARPAAGQDGAPPVNSPAAAPAGTAGAAGAGATAPADAAPMASMRKAEAQAPATPIDEKRLASDAVARLALISIRVTPDPSPDAYRLTALALRVAQRLRPTDPDLVRLEFEAWSAAGDEDRAHDATARLLVLDPADTVSQLRLLTARLRRLQVAEDRLAAYDRLLGEQGRSLDPSVRSRLALDAALLARENGDESGFVSRLTQATTLDPTNKPAAAMYATYFLDRTTDGRERMDMLANLVLADPVDPSAYTNLAGELMRRGAFAGAKRFLERGRDCLQGTGQGMGLNDWVDYLLAVWMAEGDAACLKAIQKLQDEQQVANNAEQKQLEAEGQEPGPPKEALLPPNIEGFRLAIGFATGDERMISEALRRSVMFADQTLQGIAKKEPPFDTLPPERLADIEAQARLELAAARLWAGLQIDEAEADLNALASREDDQRLAGAGLERFRALIALRRGDTTGAIAVLSRMPEDDRLARLGLAVAAELEGRTNDAVRLYAKLALEHGNTQIGAASRRRIETLLGKALAPTPEAMALEKAAREFASPWLDELTQGVQSFIGLQAEHVRGRVDVFDRVEVRLRLKNVTRWPLAVGPESPINSRFMLSPQAVIQGKPPSTYAQPEVLDLERRLRLMPGEEMTVLVWANRASIGTLLEMYATSGVSLRWRVLQGYRLDSARRFINGPMCAFAETDLLSRDAIENIEDVPTLVERMERMQGRELLETALMAGATSLKPPPGIKGEADVERRTTLARALGASLPRMNEYERAFVLSAVMRSGLYHAGTVLVDAAREDASPLVRAVLMLGAFKDPAERQISKLIDDPDPEISAMAQILHAVQVQTPHGAEGGVAAPAGERPSTGAEPAPDAPK